MYGLMKRPTTPRLEPSRCLLLAAVCIAAFCLSAWGVLPAAAQHTVEGTVTDAETGETLPGVTVVERSEEVGTTTGPRGEFELTVSGPDATLEFSFVGFETKTLPLEGRSELMVELDRGIAEMDEVVVTALGLERDRRSLGYSVESVDPGDVVDGTESNVANLLQGRIAGVDVSGVGGGPGSSARITIRGASGLDDDNQPLFVVDGVPLDNQDFGSAGQYGGTEDGDALADLNPDEIESINVLKGGAAAALYGSRARNGVVEIQTRSGRAGELRVQFRSNTTIEQQIGYFDEYQTSYGPGSNGQVPQNVDQALEWGLGGWGARMEDVDEAIQPDGEMRPYEHRMDRAGFYETVPQTKNTVTVSGGSETLTSYVSGTYLRQGNMLPELDGMERFDVTVRGNLDLDRVSVDAKANYIDQEVFDRSYIHDFQGNPHWSNSFFPNTYNMDDLRPGFDEVTLEEDDRWLTSPFFTQPWFALNRFDENSERTRFIGHVEMDVQLSDWLTASVRQGLDWGLLRLESIRPDGTRFDPGGSLSISDNRTIESNTEGRLEAAQQLTSDLTMFGFIGASLRHRDVETVGASGDNFRIPGFNALPNLASQAGSQSISRKQVRSFFGSLDLGFRDYLYLTVTGRNDWSSTLPEENNSFFYPSVSTSFVFTDAIPALDMDWLDLGKFRAAWSEVGSDTDPYQLNVTYDFEDSAQRDRQLGSLASGTIPLANLRPSSMQELELGAEFRFLGERLNVDLAWYDRNTTDQILTADVSQTTGFSSRIINVGELSNTGVELLVTAIPLEQDNMRLSFDLNFDRNTNIVESLSPGLEEIVIGNNRVLTGRSVARVGEEFSSIQTSSYVRDDDGNIVHDDDGLPLVGDDAIQGKGTPDWTAGLATNFAFGNFTVNTHVDVRWGGQVFSGTNAWATLFGLHEQTLQGRAACDEAGYPDSGCWVPNGVYEDGTSVETEVLPETYWGHVYSNIGEEFVYDRNTVMLRELSLGYRLPASLLDRVAGLESATFSVIGRNLFYLHNPVPNIDPLVARNRSNASGMEGTLMPSSRTLGLSIDVSF